MAMIHWEAGKEMKNTLIFLKAKYPWHEALETRALRGGGGGSGGRCPAQPKAC